MNLNINNMYKTIKKINCNKELNNSDLKILDSILEGKKYNIKFIDFNTCLQISSLYDYKSENKVKWLFVAEEKYNITIENTYLCILYYNIGKYYYIHNIFDFSFDNLNIAIKYFNKASNRLSNSYYYLGCIYLILEESKKKDERDYKKSYKYFKIAVDNKVREAFENEKLVKRLL